MSLRSATRPQQPQYTFETTPPRPGNASPRRAGPVCVRLGAITFREHVLPKPAPARFFRPLERGPLLRPARPGQTGECSLRPRSLASAPVARAPRPSARARGQLNTARNPVASEDVLRYYRLSGLLSPGTAPLRQPSTLQSRNNSENAPAARVAAWHDDAWIRQQTAPPLPTQTLRMPSIK